MRFNSEEEKDGRWMFLSKTTKTTQKKEKKKKKRNVVMFGRRRTCARVVNIATNATRRRESGLGGDVLNECGRVPSSSSSSSSSFSMLFRRNIGIHQQHQQQQQQQQQQHIQFETFVGGNRARVLPAHQLTMAVKTNPLLYRQLIRKVCPGIPLSKPGERQTVALEDFMKDFQVLDVHRGATGGNSSSSSAARGGDRTDLLVFNKSAKLKGVRKNTTKFFMPFMLEEKESTSAAAAAVAAENSSSRTIGAEGFNNTNTSIINNSGNGGNDSRGGGNREGGERHHHRETMWQKYRFYAFALGCALSFYIYREGVKETENLKKQNYTTEKDYEIENWSGTKKVVVDTFAQPETTEALEAIIRHASLRGKKIRPVGAALSPNGVAFEKEGMVSLALLDKVLHVDVEKKQVTVQPGARVSDVTEALRKYNLTLQNYASIREQQIGGFTQVGAHGTGAKIPPVDATVVRMKLITPARGVIEFGMKEGEENKNVIDPMFEATKVGLGSLGVASEITLQCVDAYRLKEDTFTTTPELIEKNHEKWIRKYKHVRYMWIPHTDCVVVVGSNPIDAKKKSILGLDSVFSYLTTPNERKQNKYRTKPMIDLLKKYDKESAKKAERENAGFGELRDLLLRIDPLNVDHVKKVNAAEAEFWKRSHGTRVDWSDQILGFDCGGQQHVLEVAFPCGTLEEMDEKATMSANVGVPPSLRKDLCFMRDLRKMIEENNIPAHAPIEQRWTSGSSSIMSPSHGEKHSLHSWVGIIMYLPTQVEAEREEITARFTKYGEQMRDTLGDEYLLKTHWAKIELEGNLERRKKQVERLKTAYGQENFRVFRDLRRKFDPKGVLMNELIEGLFESE